MDDIVTNPQIKEYFLDTTVVDDFNISRIFDNKISMRVIKTLNAEGFTIGERTADGELLLPTRFVDFYMAVLASNISLHHKLPTLTDNQVINPIYDQFARGDIFPIGDYDRLKFAEGLFCTLTLENIRIRDDIEISKLRKFKESHKYELQKYKRAIRELSQEIDYDQRIEVIHKQAQELFRQDISPSIDDLKKVLHFSNIKYTVEIVSMTILGIGGIGISSQFDIPAEYSLPLGVGAVIIYRLSNYVENRNKILSNEPYSYLHSIKTL